MKNLKFGLLFLFSSFMVVAFSFIFLAGSAQSTHQWDCDDLFFESDNFTCSNLVSSFTFCSTFDQTQTCTNDGFGDFRTNCFSSFLCGLSVGIAGLPSTVAPGGTVNIGWSVNHSASSCTASGSWSGSKSTSGGSENITAPPCSGTCTFTYTLTCSNNLTSASDSFTLTVVAPASTPTPTPTPTPTTPPGSTPTPTPTPTTGPCLSCGSTCGVPCPSVGTCLATQVCCEDICVGDFVCLSSSACPAPTPTPTPTVGPGTPTPTSTPGPTATPAPTSTPTPTPTPTPSVFTVTVTVSNSTPAINQPVTVTANVSGSFSSPVGFDLDCNSDGIINYSSPGTSSFPFTFSNMCAYSSSGSYTITVSATDSSSPNRTASGSAPVTILQRFACTRVTFTNSTYCQGTYSSTTYCSNSNESISCSAGAVSNESYYVNCLDCNGLEGCPLSLTGQCSLIPTPTPTPPLGLQCSAYDAQNNCISVNTAIGPIDVDPASFVSRIMSLLLGISGGIAVLLIILAGYSLMTSRDKPEAIQDARQKLLGAIVGLLFIALALVILEVIGVDILRIPGFAP